MIVSKNIIYISWLILMFCGISKHNLEIRLVEIVKNNEAQITEEN